MNSMYVISEYLTNGYRTEFLDILTIVAILSAILVIISKNPIVSVLFLIGLFLSISSYLITLGLNFIGLSYLLVYVGAVSILFLFILMLINVRISELLSDTNNSIPLAIFLGISFYSQISKILPFSIANISNNSFNLNALNNIMHNNDNLNNYYLNNFFNMSDKEYKGITSLVSSQNWDGNLSESSDITSIGNIMYTSYSIWLILTSLILLLAMIGAIVITIKQKN